MENRNWEYHPNPRLEGLCQAAKYIKWENITEEELSDTSDKKKKGKGEN